MTKAADLYLNHLFHCSQKSLEQTREAIDFRLAHAEGACATLRDFGQLSADEDRKWRKIFRNLHIEQLGRHFFETGPAQDCERLRLLKEARCYLANLNEDLPEKTTRIRDLIAGAKGWGWPTIPYGLMRQAVMEAEPTGRVWEVKDGVILTTYCTVGLRG